MATRRATFIRNGTQDSLKSGSTALPRSGSSKSQASGYSPNAVVTRVTASGSGSSRSAAPRSRKSDVSAGCQKLGSGCSQPSTDEGHSIPPLDKIPTNAFIESFLEEADPDKELNRGGRCRPAGDVPSRETDTETVLDIRESPSPYDDTGQHAYRKACDKYQAMPISSFNRQLGNTSASSVDMKYYGTGPKGAKAIAIPMVINSNVTSLNLKGNDLGKSGIEVICKMMACNQNISELNLADNNLQANGSKSIAEMLSPNKTIKHLDISGNGFTDSDATVLAQEIQSHPTLKYVNLSHNSFGENSGKAFRRLIGENEVLVELDLSWNRIRARGAVDIAKGVKENVGLKTLHLAWNGFSDDGAKEMAVALKCCTLVVLDLTCNRIGHDGFRAICRALQHNDDLKVLKLGRNNIAEQDAALAMEFLVQLPELGLESLELAEMTYGVAFKAKLKEVTDKFPGFSCRHGYMDSYGQRKLRRYNVVEEALVEMRKYCRDNNINIVELFSRFDADGSMSVTHEEFKQGLREARIPLTDLQIHELIQTLDQDGDGEIDFSEMVLGAEMFKDEKEEGT